MLDGQLDAQQTQANEQLEALQHESNALRKAAEQAVTEHDAMHQDTTRFQMLGLRLQTTVHGSQLTSTPNSELQVRCTRAEAKVA